MKTEFPFLCDLIKSFNKKHLLNQIADTNDDYLLDEWLCDWFVEESHVLLDKQLTNLSFINRFQEHRKLEYALVNNGYVVYGEDHWFTDTYQKDLTEDEFDIFWDNIDNDPTDPFYKYTPKFESEGNWI